MNLIDCCHNKVGRLKMERFSIQKSLGRGTTAQFFVSGAIDESSKFPALLEIGKATAVNIDLKGVTSLNSIGIRAWCQWIDGFGAIPIVVEHVPALVVKAFNIVLGAYPPNMQIASFFVPYHSQKEGRKDILFLRGVHYLANGEVRAPATVKEGSSIFELDVLPSYFKFINAYIKT